MFEKRESLDTLRQMNDLQVPYSDIETPRSELKSEASFLTNFLTNKYRINKKTI